MLSITIRIISVVVLISIFLTPLLIQVGYSHAVSSPPGQRHSKDYKLFPPNSPEAVLTSFIEADLGHFYNRQTDDRYPLWWGLIEEGGVPENGYLKLYINSYRIDKKSINEKTGEVIVDLEMDVRAVWSSGNPRHSESSWNDIKVKVGGIEYSLRSSQFIELVFGKNKNSENISKKVIANYPTLRAMRIWIFPVRMTNKDGKWFIAIDSIPPEVSYVHSKLDWYKEKLNQQVAINHTCNGNRKFDRHLLEPYSDLVRNRVGRSLAKFRKEFCSRQEIEEREQDIRQIMETSQKFRSMTMD